VYRKFQDIDEFRQEIDRIRHDSRKNEAQLDILADDPEIAP